MFQKIQIFKIYSIVIVCDYIKIIVSVSIVVVVAAVALLLTNVVGTAMHRSVSSLAVLQRHLLPRPCQ